MLTFKHRKGSVSFRPVYGYLQAEGFTVGFVWMEIRT